MTEENIRKIDSLIEAVRLRPGMYLGGNDGRAMLHAIFLVIVCGLGQAPRNQIASVEITLKDRKKFVIKDNGPGLPIDVHPQLNIAWVEALLTRLDCRSEFWPNSFLYSLAFTNAVSVEGHVQVRRDGQVWEQAYQAGELTSPFKQIRALSEGESTGNMFTFTLDPTVFEADATISYPDLVVHLREIAYLLPGLKITLGDERQNPVAAHEFHYPNGLTDFVTYLNRDCKVLHEVIHSTDEIELRLQNRKPYLITVDFAIQFTDNDVPFQLSYVNLNETLDGGVHIDALRQAVGEAISFVAKDKQLSAPASEDELLRGMTAVIHVQHPDPHYAGCTRQRLVNPDARVVNPAVFAAVKAFFWRDREVLQRVLDRPSSRALPIQERRYGEYASQVKYRFVMF